MPELFKHGVLHRTLTDRFRNSGNDRQSVRSLQQLMGQLPICFCLKAKKFNDFSRAGVGVCVCREAVGAWVDVYSGKGPARCFALRFLWIVERHFCELGLAEV